jgi:hypothetical protein
MDLIKIKHKENLTETDEYIYLQHPQKRQTATRVTSLIHFKLYRKETDGYIYMEHAQKRLPFLWMLQVYIFISFCQVLFVE